MTITGEQIIAWAREAGFEELVVDEVIHLNELKHFAALIEQAVRQDEREACAKACLDAGMACETRQGADLCFELSEAIRARGN